VNDITPQHERPLLQKIVDFPLVAMIAAITLYVFARALELSLGKFVSLGQPATPIVQAAIALALTLAVYKLAIVRLGEHPKDDLPATGSLSDLGKGIAIGAILFSAVTGGAALLGVYKVTGEGSASDLLILLVTSALIPAFMEEIFFRGILFRWIEEFGGSWAALVVTSALFGLAHILNPGATWFSSFAIAVEAGLLLGACYMLTRSLWMPIGLHAAWNFTQGAIFGVPVSGHPTTGLLHARLTGPELLSGGAFGLEASVIALGIATAAGLWLLWLAIRRGELMRPWWVRRRAANS
jgi:hypothetical protein